MEMSRAVMPTEALLFLCAEAAYTANFIRNIAPHCTLGRTPYEALYGGKPSVKPLQPFSTKVYFHVPIEVRAPGSKLLHRVKQGLFVNYDRNTKACPVYVPDQHIIPESCDMRF
jgi:hypothetical protein